MVCTLTESTISFVGHIKAVTYLALHKTDLTTSDGIDVLLATASDDGLVIVWDCATVTKKCEISGDGELCSALCWSAIGDTLYVAYNDVICAYATETLLATPSGAQPERKFTSNKDEIGQITVDQKNQYIAAADDSGEVRILDTHTTKQASLLTRTHTNICSSVSFIRDRPGECVSGGLDGKLVLWDCNRCVPKHVVDFMDVPQEGASATPMFNPPMVNCVKVSSNGRRMAAGLADGTVRVFDLVNVRSQGPGNAGKGGKGKKQKQKKPPRRVMQQIRCLRGAHRHAVSAFVMLEGCVMRNKDGENANAMSSDVKAGSSNAESSPDSSARGVVSGNGEGEHEGKAEGLRYVDEDSLCIVSAGADKKICVWDVRDSLNDTAPEEPYDGLVSDGLLLTIKHPHTINWIDAVVVSSGGGVTVMVADQTPNVTLYQLTF
ncbi:hypothetical protein SARC_02197 [Sphaeroforma arctica JP610]|uniref:Uncharacterized protein n=1 Tax=Sphaeroforma arctica JP610 TaxID=667725 RepID=A0A0L0G9P9_9EUKA|nr:hypothetical protein SARC_02197 [Sphaeroforma arctica JP610]KNC85624.1 hypothetical protein SARC_02197 [Sphaeroforma arctica JP610]|eukprot:XP_014159526.1 hypothetical protein SARC_02197 [Sphaeroforma arctica JP610]